MVQKAEAAEGPIDQEGGVGPVPLGPGGPPQGAVQEKLGPPSPIHLEEDGHRQGSRRPGPQVSRGWALMLNFRAVRSSFSSSSLTKAGFTTRSRLSGAM